MATKRPVFNPELGQFFTALREAKGWKQSQAADVAARRRIDVSYQTIRGLEEGKTKNADPEALRAIAKLYEHPYELIAAAVFSARYGVTASGNDLIWQSVDQQSGTSSHVGETSHDSVAARILKLESENTELRSALDKIAHVASDLVQIAKVGHQGDPVRASRPARRGRDRKTG